MSKSFTPLTIELNRIYSLLPRAAFSGGSRHSCTIFFFGINVISYIELL